MDTEISRYLVDANGNSFSSDTDLQSLSKNAKVKNTNSGVSYKKVQGTSVPVFDKVPFQEGQPDAVLYSQQTLTTAQQNQARANINAMGLVGFSQTAISQVAEDMDKLRFMTPNNTLIATVYKSRFPNLFSHLAPTVQTVLWSGDLNHGDITLRTGFDNFDVLMFIYSTNDQSPSTDSTWRYSVIPVWVLRKIIIDHNFFGLTENYFDLCQDDMRYWRISVADSTSTFLKYYDNEVVQMWRVVGLRFTTTVAPENGSSSSGSSGSGGSSSTETTVEGTWYYVSTSSKAPSSTTLIPSSSIWAKYKKGSGSGGYTYYSSTTTYTGSGSHPSNGSYKATWSRIGAGSNYLYKATGIIKVA